jgi:UDP-N-acetylglucosamine:LPS N-acetylglucosamine transferase
LRNGVAVKAEKTRDVAEYVANFLRDPRKLASMREAATGLGRPYAADHAAVDVMALMGNHSNAPSSL